MKIDFTGCIVPPGKLATLQAAARQNETIEEVIGLPAAQMAPVGYGAMFVAAPPPVQAQPGAAAFHPAP